MTVGLLLNIIVIKACNVNYKMDIAIWNSKNSSTHTQNSKVWTSYFEMLIAILCTPTGSEVNTLNAGCQRKTEFLILTTNWYQWWQYIHFQWRVWYSQRNVQPAEHELVHSEAMTAFCKFTATSISTVQRFHSQRHSHQCKFGSIFFAQKGRQHIKF